MACVYEYFDGQAEAFAEKIKPLLAKGKKDYLWEGIASKAIPQPQLLVKDHKVLMLPPEGFLQVSSNAHTCAP
eukprot:14793726-Ditylum_brightwellii.AAC.1